MSRLKSPKKRKTELKKEDVKNSFNALALEELNQEHLMVKREERRKDKKAKNHASF